MGACNFQTFVAGDQPVADAYKKAVEDALYYSGHDPYNGTISTTSGYQVVHRAPDRAAADKLVNQYWEYEDSQEYDFDTDEVSYGVPNPFGPATAEKWGLALAIKAGSEGWVFFGWAAC